jgi:DNA-binding transcriptional regulator YdaS (Cro superfamily)
LTEEKVARIKSEFPTLSKFGAKAALARELGISPQQLSAIAYGRSWK